MRLLITGASGQLGAYLLKELQGSPHQVTAWSGTRTGELFGFHLVPMDLSQSDQVATAFRQVRPEAVIHAAALANVADCWQNRKRAQAINADSSGHLSFLASEMGSKFLAVSTDLVFDGEKGNYAETDAANPLSIYGRSKRAGEKMCMENHPQALVVRLGLLFGPSQAGRTGFFDQQIDALRKHRPRILFEDEWRTPLSFKTAARTLIALAGSEVTGLLHVGGPESLSRLEMGRQLAVFLKQDPALFVPACREDQAAPEPRPRDVSLNCQQWRTLFPQHPWPTFEESLRELDW